MRPETAARVQEAINELGYRRNRSARLLASSRSRLIGVATWGTSQFGPQQMLLALDAAARSSEYRLSLRTVHELTEHRDPRRRSRSCSRRTSKRWS